MTKTGLMLKAKREKLSLSQRALSKKTGIHIQYISNIERGVSMPPKRKLIRISSALNIPLSTIADHMADDYKYRLIAYEK